MRRLSMFADAKLLGNWVPTKNLFTCIGSTTRDGGEANSRPVHVQEIFATLYHNLGIDIEQETINDHSGRPQYLIDHSKYHAMPELIRNPA